MFAYAIFLRKQKIKHVNQDQGVVLIIILTNGGIFSEKGGDQLFFGGTFFSRDSFQGADQQFAAIIDIHGRDLLEVVVNFSQHVLGSTSGGPLTGFSFQKSDFGQSDGQKSKTTDGNTGRGQIGSGGSTGQDQTVSQSLAVGKEGKDSGGGVVEDG